MADWLVTPEQLSQWTGGKVLSTDTRVQPLLNGATAGIRRYCGWHIGPSESATFTLDGPGGDLIVLPTLKLNSVTSVTEEGTALTLYSTTTDSGDYEWSANGEIRRMSYPYVWTERYRALSVVVTHGFAVTDLADVAQVIKQVCAAALSSPMGATREQAGQLSVSWATTAPGVAGGMSLLERDLATLDLYRLPKAA